MLMSFNSTRSSVVVPFRCPCAPVLPIECRPRRGCGPGCCTAAGCGGCAAPCCCTALWAAPCCAAPGFELWFEFWIEPWVAPCCAAAGDAAPETTAAELFSGAVLASAAGFASTAARLGGPSVGTGGLPLPLDGACLPSPPTRVRAGAGGASVRVSAGLPSTAVSAGLLFSLAVSAGFTSLVSLADLPSPLFVSNGFSVGVPSVAAAGATACS